MAQDLQGLRGRVSLSVLSSVPEARRDCTSDNLKAAIVFLC